jgi:hypothetical protein
MLNRLQAFYCLQLTSLYLARAVPELLYPGTIDIEWHFPQENATFHDSNKATDTLEPLQLALQG